MIAAAKMGFKAVGYELNPWLVWYSRYRAWRDGVHHNTKFYISDLWKVGAGVPKNEWEISIVQRYFRGRIVFVWPQDAVLGFEKSAYSMETRLTARLQCSAGFVL